MIRRIEIIVKGVHRSVGYIDFETSTYYTKRAYKNIMRSYYGFGISTPIIDYLLDNDVSRIVIVCTDRSYGISLTQFYINGFIHNDGSDEQIILPMSYFAGVKPGMYIIDNARQKEMFIGRYSYKPKTAQYDFEITKTEDLGANPDAQLTLWN